VHSSLSAVVPGLISRVIARFDQTASASAFVALRRAIFLDQIHCWQLNPLVRFWFPVRPREKQRALPDPMLSRNEYMRVKEAAELLGVCLNTIRAGERDGRIPEIRHRSTTIGSIGVPTSKRLLDRVDPSAKKPTQQIRRRPR